MYRENTVYKVMQHNRGKHHSVGFLVMQSSHFNFEH